jgi:hypothetical protein
MLLDVTLLVTPRLFGSRLKKLALLLFALRCLSAQTSPCDLNSDGVINILDVQLAIDQSMGQVTCSTANFLLDGCTQADVQIVLTAALGGLCNAGQTAQSIPPTSSTDSMTIYEVDGVNQTGRSMSAASGRGCGDRQLSGGRQESLAGQQRQDYDGKLRCSGIWPWWIAGSYVSACGLLQ